MQIQRKRSEQDSGRSVLSWQDDERLQSYVGFGHDLVQKTPLGHQLECFRDNVRIQGMPSTHPPGDWGYSQGTAYNRARETALRLWDTERILPGSVATLWDYCHPEAVTLEGLPGGRGRIFVLYPRTSLGRRARRSAGANDTCSLVVGRLLGPRECKCKHGIDCLCFTRHALARQLYAESASAKGEVAELWREIHTAAERLLFGARDAWIQARSAEDDRRAESKLRRRVSARAGVVTTATSDG